MKLLKLDQITGNEILAKSILTSDYQELLTEGTQLKLGYLSKLSDMGITEVFVKDNEVDTQAKEILKKEVNQKCKEKVRDIISKHTYNKSQDMQEISLAADSIITEILEDENIIEQVFDIRERSADIYEHSISTCTMATLVALKMKIDKDRVRNIGIGCLLHDLGLRYVTVDYTNIEIDFCDNEKQIEEYHKHTVYGYSAVNNETWLDKVCKEIILCHHERLDDSGYPLHTSALSLETKIAAVCDFFDESICGIGYERKKVYEVVEQLKIYKGIYFDSNVVDELLDFIAVYPSGSKVITNEGDTAVVIRQNKGFPERPVIQLLIDKNGNMMEKKQLRDLLVYNNLFIERVLN